MFYIFHGDDTFTLDEELNKLSAKLGDPGMAELNTAELDGRTVTWEELFRHCNSMPFLSDRRLVVVRGLLTRLEHRVQRDADAKFLERLVTYLPELPPTTRLVLVEPCTLPSRHPVLALARANAEGHEQAFAAPTGNALTRWVQQRVRQQGGEIGVRAVQLLCAYVDDDLFQLHQEIQKLVAYTNGDRPITESDIELLTPRARQANIFHMVDALARRDGKTASQLYHRLLDTGSHPLAILGMITRQFRLIIQVKELAPTHGTAREIARAIGQKPYPTQKVLVQSRNYTMDQLHRIYQRLLDTDLAIKTGQLEPTLALDTLIAELSCVA